jgi:hypothetical protein
MEYRLPVNGVQVPGFVQDPEEIDPTQPRTMLPRTRKKSAGGAVTNNVKPEDELGSGRGMLARALQMYSQGPDTAALNELAQQRMREGDSSMLNALAAQFAGSDFEPVQGVLLKRAMAAQEPQKVGNYGLISGGKFVADPYAARDTQAGAMMDIGGELFRDERATEREDRRDARFFAQQERLARQFAARQGGADAAPATAAVNVGGVAATPTIITPEVQPSEAVGLGGKWQSMWNKAFDAVGLGNPASANRVATERLDALANQTQLYLQDAVPGRPSNYLLQLLEKQAIRPNQAFMGEAGAASRVQATMAVIDTGLADNARIINNPAGYSANDVAKARDGYARLSQLKSEYQALGRGFGGDAAPADPGLDDLVNKYSTSPSR